MIKSWTCTATSTLWTRCAQDPRRALVVFLIAWHHVVVFVVFFRFFPRAPDRPQAWACVRKQHEHRRTTWWGFSLKPLPTKLLRFRVQDWGRRKLRPGLLRFLSQDLLGARPTVDQILQVTSVRGTAWYTGKMFFISSRSRFTLSTCGVWVVTIPNELILEKDTCVVFFFGRITHPPLSWWQRQRQLRKKLLFIRKEIHRNREHLQIFLRRSYSWHRARMTLVVSKFR